MKYLQIAGWLAALTLLFMLAYQGRDYKTEWSTVSPAGLKAPTPKPAPETPKPLPPSYSASTR